MSDFQIRVIVKYLRNIFVKILGKLCEENLLIVKVSDSLEKLCMNFNVEIEYCENYACSICFIVQKCHVKWIN